MKNRSPLELLELIDAEEARLADAKRELLRVLANRYAVTTGLRIKLQPEEVKMINTEIVSILHRCRTVADVEMELQWYAPQRRATLETRNYSFIYQSEKKQ